jgi:hypothetical protein
LGDRQGNLCQKTIQRIGRSFEELGGSMRGFNKMRLMIAKLSFTFLLGSGMAIAQAQQPLPEKLLFSLFQKKNYSVP